MVFKCSEDLYKKVLILIGFLFLTFIFARAEETGKKIAGISTYSGTVESVEKSGNYIYVKIKGEKGEFWTAVYASTVKPGDRVEIKNPLLMKNFYSKSLKKKFKLILFTSAIYPVGTKPIGSKGINKAPVSAHGMSMKNSFKTDLTVKSGSVEKAKGGFTIEECFKKSDELNGKIIVVKGIAVRVSRKIMGKNWVHLRDGSGKPGKDDVTFTTQSEINIGDIITVRGKIEFGKSIGNGYTFPALISNPDIKVEKRAVDKKK